MSALPLSSEILYFSDPLLFLVFKRITPSDMNNCRPFYLMPAVSKALGTGVPGQLRLLIGREGPISYRQCWYWADCSISCFFTLLVDYIRQPQGNALALTGHFWDFQSRLTWSSSGEIASFPILRGCRSIFIRNDWVLSNSFSVAPGVHPVSLLSLILFRVLMISCPLLSIKSTSLLMMPLNCPLSCNIPNHANSNVDR